MLLCSRIYYPYIAEHQCGTIDILDPTERKGNNAVKAYILFHFRMYLRYRRIKNIKKILSFSISQKSINVASAYG